MSRLAGKQYEEEEPYSRNGDKWDVINRSFFDIRQALTRRTAHHKKKDDQKKKKQEKDHDEVFNRNKQRGKTEQGRKGRRCPQLASSIRLAGEVHPLLERPKRKKKKTINEGVQPSEN